MGTMPKKRNILFIYVYYRTHHYPQCLKHNHPNLKPLVPSHLPPCTPIGGFAFASGYLRFLGAPLPPAFPLALLAGGPPNLIPISGFQTADVGATATGGGATGALVGVGAVSGSSAGAGAL